MPNQNNKNTNSGVNPVGIVAAVGIGVVAAVGGYLFGRYQDEEKAQQNAAAARQAQALPRPPTHNINNAPSSAAAAAAQDEDEKLDKPVQDRECVICFRGFEDLMKSDEEIHTTPCGHVFCYKCIHKALVERGRCPVCRKHVDVDHTLRIFL